MINLLPGVLSTVSALASVFAILISIKSCQVSNDAFDLASAEYIQGRSLLLTAEFSENNESIKLKPTNDEITFLTGTVTFPSEIYGEAVPVSSSGALWRMGAITPNLQDYALKKAPRETGLIKAQSLTIPIIIDSYYAVKGDTYTDRSLYLLRYDAFIHEDLYKQPSLYFRGLLFSLRESQLQKLDADLLKKIINNEMRVIMPYGAPSLLPKK
ncbi:hypothetical protein BK661_10140 [Pseudomonas frederiksbergensis]|uniref:Uncharacterized protein n=1 Tax=Pseudomonas frederiksbergensis TaxID=104087 RepID=A0A423J9Q7_9PSED|nr:hypothetical protein [Pseudomonas frederiksbergensis]RON34430.1 hypothetical protein BK661_10140 [Pseudomonas frederiksbergensis]